jgi:allantoinase
MWAARDYGNRVGVFRIMNVLDKHGIRATVALNSDICVHHAAIIEEGKARKWEWMGHGQTNTRRLNEAPPGVESKIIQDCVADITQATGSKPVGWLSSGLQETWDTLELLADNGIEYVCDWVNDDQPYRMTLENGRGLISVPYSNDINDKPAYEQMYRTPADFKEMICRQFDVLYREGAETARVMAIALHPYLSGLPYRIDALDEALAYICAHQNVWKTTGSEIAKHYSANAARQR